MCEPATIMLAVSAVGAGMTAVSAYNNSQAQKSSLLYQGAVAENNAKTIEYQAQDVERRGQQDLINARRENDRLKGAQRATMAARGLDLTEGTPATLLQDTDYFGAVDQANIKNTTAKNAWATRVGAQNSASDATMLNNKAGSISPGMAATTSLMTSAGSVASSWYKTSAKTTGPAATDRDW